MDSGRIVGIMEQRANAYQAMVWHILQSQGIVLPPESTIKVLVIHHTDEVWPANWQTEVPTVCKDEGVNFSSREELMQHLALIPTLFRISSECDKALLHTAARLGVVRKQDEIRKFLSTQNSK